MIEFQVVPGAPEIIEGISKEGSKNAGKKYRIVKQAAIAKMPNGSVMALSIQPPFGAEPYAPGRYTLAPESFYSKDGQLAFSVKLVPAAGGGTK